MTKVIGKLSAKDQWAWCKAQFEELEALKKCNVYELADLPSVHRFSPMDQKNP